MVCIRCAIVRIVDSLNSSRIVLETTYQFGLRLLLGKLAQGIGIVCEVSSIPMVGNTDELTINRSSSFIHHKYLIPPQNSSSHTTNQLVIHD